MNTNPFHPDNLDPIGKAFTAIKKGDLPGHEFHGNQYTNGFANNAGWAKNGASGPEGVLDRGVLGGRAYTVDTSGRSSGLTASDPAPRGKDMPTPLVSEVTYGDNRSEKSRTPIQYHIASNVGGEVPGEHPQGTFYDSIRLKSDGYVTFPTEVMRTFDDGDGWNQPREAGEETFYNYVVNLKDNGVIDRIGQAVADTPSWTSKDSPLAGCKDFSYGRDLSAAPPATIKPDTMVWGTTPEGDRAPMATLAQILHANSELGADDGIGQMAQEHYDSY